MQKERQHQNWKINVLEIGQFMIFKILNMYKLILEKIIMLILGWSNRFLDKDKSSKEMVWMKNASLVNYSKVFVTVFGT